MKRSHVLRTVCALQTLGFNKPLAMLPHIADNSRWPFRPSHSVPQLNEDEINLEKRKPAEAGFIQIEISST
jgi:hypothetical protein